MADESSPSGLTSEEANRRLRTFGPNSVPLREPSRVRLFLLKFWGPIPWMLEATLILEILLGKNLEAAILATLLLINGLLAFQKERKGQKALDLLRSRLEIRARVRRDGLWQEMSATGLVPGDLIHVRMGDFVPADMELGSGDPLLDQSSLTGESLPVEKEIGQILWSGSVVRRGEGTGTVIQTGARCAFGKTAQLVHDAKTRSHFEEVVLQIVRSLLLFDLFLALILFPLAIHAGTPLANLIPFVLILLISAIPVALPPTFTLANALSAAALSRKGVLVTRLSAISDAAVMEDLLCDKTGTLTENRLAVIAVRPLPGISEREVLEAAMAASDISTRDPLEMAIFDYGTRSGDSLLPKGPRISFLPFDPATKRTEAVIAGEGEETFRIVKGSPGVMPALGIPEEEIRTVGQSGQRTIAVAKGPSGPDGKLALMGLISFSDPLRKDTIEVVRAIRSLGIRILLVTGDTPEATDPIARALSMALPPCSPASLSPAGIGPCEVFAGVLPEDKFRLIGILQKEGRIVGMTGDGVNDAPALKQAEVGIAVSKSSDIARAGASMILVDPGLSGIAEVVEEGRRVYHRIQNYVLNKVVKTLEVALFLTGGLLLFHSYVVSSRMVLLLIFTNDFVTMALASDRVRFSGHPNRWNIRRLVLTAILIACLWLALTLTVFYAGRAWFHLPAASCQTLAFLTLVLTGLGNVLVIRERGPLWKTRPSDTLLLAMAGDLLLALALAGTPLLLSPVSPPFLFGLLALVVLATLAIDRVKGFLLGRPENLGEGS